MELLQLTEQFLHYQLHNRRASVHTVEAYRNDLEQWNLFLKDEGYTDITTVTSKVLRNWIAHMHESGISARSIHRKMSALRTFLKYLRKQDILKKDLTANLSLPKMPRKLVSSVSVIDLQNMFKNFPWEEEENGERNRLVLLLFYSTGIRLTELITLKQSDVDFNRNLISVLGKRNKIRLVPLHPEISDYLKAYCTLNRGTFVFMLPNNKPLYRMYIYRLVNHYLQLFSSSLKTSPHVLRHSFATHMLNNGANLMAIKEILGHASLAATQIYTQNSLEQLIKVHRNTHPRSKK